MRSTGFPHSLPLLVCGAVLASAVTQPAVAQQTADASAAPPAVAKPSAKRRAKSEGQPALLTADQIVHDRDLDIVTARGHVEVDQGGRILLADSLSYNMKQDVVVAAGNVSLTEETGEVTFADYIELTGDLKDGTTKSVRILMIDDSRIAANQGRRRAGDRSVFDKALYTACGRPTAKPKPRSASPICRPPVMPAMPPSAGIWTPAPVSILTRHGGPAGTYRDRRIRTICRPSATGSPTPILRHGLMWKVSAIAVMPPSKATASRA